MVESETETEREKININFLHGKLTQLAVDCVYSEAWFLIFLVLVKI